MKTRKIAGIFAAVTLLVGVMTGCGSAASDTGTTEDITTESTTQTASTAEESSSAEDTDASTEGSQASDDTAGKTLVVYYSASGTTRSVAEMLAEAADADLFEITPSDPYTSADLDWTDDNSRVTREHEDESLRDVELTQVTPDNWENYDVVYIGYPIWWGIAAWPVNNFVSGNDFTGKTVIPFCTSASSGIGNSGTLLAQMAGTGDWQEGQRFSSRTSADEISSWINELGL